MGVWMWGGEGCVCVGVLATAILEKTPPHPPGTPWMSRDIHGSTISLTADISEWLSDNHWDLPVNKLPRLKIRREKKRQGWESESWVIIFNEGTAGWLLPLTPFILHYAVLKKGNHNARSFERNLRSMGFSCSLRGTVYDSQGSGFRITPCPPIV